MADPDGFYEAWVAAHEGLSDEESADLDARLVLLLANQVGDTRCCWPASRRRASKGVGARERRRRGAGVTALSILVVGLLLGMKHATEADHLAAVATLATRRGLAGADLAPGRRLGRRPHPDADAVRRRGAAARPGDLARPRAGARDRGRDHAGAARCRRAAPADPRPDPLPCSPPPRRHRPRPCAQPPRRGPP